MIDPKLIQQLKDLKEDAKTLHHISDIFTAGGPDDDRAAIFVAAALIATKLDNINHTIKNFLESIPDPYDNDLDDLTQQRPYYPDIDLDLNKDT